MITKMLKQFCTITKLPQTLAQVVKKKDASLVPVSTEPKEVWLSQLLHSMEICSRSQANRLITVGMVKVNGKLQWKNEMVNENALVEIVRRKDLNSHHIPMPMDTKLWLFYKPRNLCTFPTDKKQSVLDYLGKLGFKTKKCNVIGKLDFNAEGLVILTNNEDLHQAINLQINLLPREYRIRLHGKIKEEFFERLKKGIIIKNKQYKPVIVRFKQIWVFRKQSTNFWTKAVFREWNENRIRRLLEYGDLRINRFVRYKFGNFTLTGMKPGELREVKIEKELHRLLLSYYQYKAEAE